MTVTIRYWAAARAAAGVEQESVDGARTLADLVGAVSAAHADPRLDRVLSVCSFLVDETPVGTRRHEDVTLSDGAVVEALPPFAGG